MINDPAPREDTRIPGSDDLPDWDKAAQEFQQNILFKLQASAGVWATGLTSFLGLFGTVALVTGTDDIQKVSGWLRPLLIGTIVISGGLLAGSVYFCTSAQALPHVESKNWNGEAYRIYVHDNLPKVRKSLRRGQVLGVGAGVLVFMVGVTALINSAMSA